MLISGSNYSENKKWQAHVSKDNSSYDHKSENDGKPEEDNSHYYGEKSKLTHASQTFYNKSKIPGGLDENFSHTENLPHNHMFVNVVYDMGNYLSDHNGDLNHIKDGNDSDEVGPRLGPPLDNKKSQTNISDLAISTTDSLEASDKEITTSYIEKYKDSSTGQDSVGPHLRSSSGPPSNDAQDLTKIFDLVTTTDSFETKDQETTVWATENYEGQQNVESQLRPPVNKIEVQTKTIECVTTTDRLLLTTSSSTRDYKDHSTEKNDQAIQIHNNNGMEADTTTQEAHTSRSTANTVPTMNDSAEVSHKIIASSSVEEAFESTTGHARDHCESSPYSTTVLIVEEKSHQSLEKENDRETTIYSTKFDYSEGPDESTDFTTKRIESAEPDELDPSSRFDSTFIIIDL